MNAGKPEAPHQEDPPQDGAGNWSSEVIEWFASALGPYLDEGGCTCLKKACRSYEEAKLDQLELLLEKSPLSVFYSLGGRQWPTGLRGRVRELRGRCLEKLGFDRVPEVCTITLEWGLMLAAELESMELRERIRALERERVEAREVFRWLRRVSGSREKAPEEGVTVSQVKVYKRRLKRLQRKLGALRDEALLSKRLESFFGHGPVRLFNRLSFFALMLLLLVFLVDIFLPKTETIAEGLFWLDTGICLFFLWEFSVRLLFAPNRRFWFRRHVLTDFLPALPFGLLLSTASGADVLAKTLGTGVIRSIRLVRIPVYARYVRLLRPMVNFFRLIAFWLRGMDRIVEGLSPLLNVEVILFEASPPKANEEVAPGEAMLPVAEFRRLPPELRKERAPELLERLIQEMERVGRRGIPVEGSATKKSSSRIMAADSLVFMLRSLDADQVTRSLPEEQIYSLGRFLKLLDIPLFRHLPGWKQLLGGGGDVPPDERIARAGRAIGGGMGRVLRVVDAWMDLSGVLTAPQILDRIATALMRSTQRPAVRLLLFGSLFILFKLFFQIVLPMDAPKLFHFLDKFVATPLLIVGTIALLLLLLGRWLKRLAGESGGQLIRAAESRYSNLTELLRIRSEDQTIRQLSERVFPGDAAEAEGLEGGIRREAAALRLGVVGDGINLRARKFALLLLDAEDGGFLHKTDTKGPEQFLENPDLVTLRREALSYTQGDEKRLGRLDLSTTKALFGPYFWFDLLTEALSVQVAKLCNLYNLYLIPLSAWDCAGKKERERHLAVLQGDEELPVVPERNGGFATSFFHVLHFLDPSEECLAEVAKVFGDEVRDRLVEDRRRMVRRIFSTKAMSKLPRSLRAFNPLSFYRGKLGGGRIFFLPFLLLWMVLRFLGRVVRITVKATYEILRPRIQGRADEVETSPRVVRRKLRRMKKPLCFEAIRLMAQLDPAYLGIEGEPQFSKDLDAIGAGPGEWDQILDAKEDMERRLVYLPELLQKVEARGGRSLEAWEKDRLRRGVARDERGLCALIAAPSRLKAWLEREGDEIPPGGLPRSRALARCSLRRGWKTLRSSLAGQRNQIQSLRRALKEKPLDLQQVLLAFDRAGKRDPSQAALDLALSMLRHQNQDLDRLQTVRGLTALILRDLRQHEDLVLAIGAYSPASLPLKRPPASPPTPSQPR